MAKKRKLNSIRLLESRVIPHQIHRYDARIRDAQAVAEAVGLPPESVFKTLVAEVPSQKKAILVMLPCNRTLNLKRLAKSLGAKKVALASHADAEKLTGLQVRRHQRAGADAEALASLPRQARAGTIAYRYQRRRTRDAGAPGDPCPY